MFILRYFATNIRSLSRTLALRKEKGWKVVLYFLFLTLLMSFPLNYAIVRENGWNLNFISARLQENMPSWYPFGLPSDCSVSPQGLTCTSTTSEVVLQGGVFEVVINGTRDSAIANQQTLILAAEKIYMVDAQGGVLETDYRGFTRTISFQELRVNEPEISIIEFSESIENSFGAYMIIFSVITNLWVTLLLNIIYLFLFSALVMIFKIGYQQFMTFREAMKLAVMAMTIPTIISIVVGFLSPSAFAFSSVITAFGIPLIMILLIKIPGKKEFMNRF